MYKLQSDHRKRKINILHNGCMRDVTITNNIIKYFRKSISQKSLAKHQKELQIPLVPVKISTLSYKALSVFKEKKEKKKSSSTGKSSYQRLYPILFLHLLPQLLKARLHAVMKRPQCLCDLLSMDPNTFSEMRNLVEEKQQRETTSSNTPWTAEMRDQLHAASSFRGMH